MTHSPILLTMLSLGFILFSGQTMAEVAQAKIANGVDSSIAEAPWSVALAIGTLDANNNITAYSRFCAGNLISNQWIVSAQHCFADQILRTNQAYFAIIGQQNLGNAIPTSAFYRIDRIVKRSDYNAANYDNDISLSRLTSPLNFNNCNGCKAVKWSNNDADSNINTNVFVAGWGATENASFSDTLQSTTLNIVNCVSNRTGLSYTIGGANLSSNTICAQSAATPPSDTCPGDSGSGLIANYGTDRASLVGITSFSITGNNRNSTCNNSTEFPGGYTKVSNYCQWINLNTGLSNNCVSSNQTNNNAVVENLSTASTISSSSSGGGGGSIGLGSLIAVCVAVAMRFRAKTNAKKK